MVTLFFFNDTATTEIYTLSLHDALPISRGRGVASDPEPNVPEDAEHGPSGPAPRHTCGYSSSSSRRPKRTRLRVVPESPPRGAVAVPPRRTGRRSRPR